MLGALFATAYLLADRLAPAGSGTRTFAWLVTANNGGLAVGAAVAGALSDGSGCVGGTVVRGGLRARRAWFPRPWRPSCPHAYSGGHRSREFVEYLPPRRFTEHQGIATEGGVMSHWKM